MLRSVLSLRYDVVIACVFECSRLFPAMFCIRTMSRVVKHVVLTFQVAFGTWLKFGLCDLS